jgi:hypothetical protein
MRCGPYSFEQLKQFATSGLIVPDDMLLQNGAQKWVPAKFVTGLFASTATPKPLATAVPTTAPSVLAVRSSEPVVAVALDASRQQSPPALWNPNAAANWSLLFTPIFGAYLQAVNWRTLGRPDKAAVNLAWVWATVAFLAINVGLILLPEGRVPDQTPKAVAFGLLLVWYFTQRKAQAGFVEQTLRGGYVKRPWGLPITIGVFGIFAYLGERNRRCNCGWTTSRTFCQVVQV